MPIPRNMLSHSDDVDIHEEDNENEPFNKIKFEEDAQEWIEELDLKDIIYFKKVPNNTKNVLRNFGNAQNQYILYNK